MKRSLCLSLLALAVSAGGVLAHDDASDSAYTQFSPAPTAFPSVSARAPTRPSAAPGSG